MSPADAIRAALKSYDELPRWRQAELERDAMLRYLVAELAKVGVKVSVAELSDKVRALGR